MSHHPTCSWDGTHEDARGYRAAYFLPLTLAVRRTAGAAAAEALERAFGQAGDDGALFSVLSPAEAEAGLALAEKAVGRRLDALSLRPEECWFQLPVHRRRPYGTAAALQAFIDAAAQAQNEGVWSLGYVADAAVPALDYTGTDLDSRLFEDYRRALLKALFRAATFSYGRLSWSEIPGAQSAGLRYHFDLRRVGPAGGAAVAMALVALSGPLYAGGGAGRWLLFLVAAGGLLLAVLSPWLLLRRRGSLAWRWDSELASSDPRQALCRTFFADPGSRFAYFDGAGSLRFVSRSLFIFLEMEPGRPAEQLQDDLLRRVGARPWKGARALSLSQGGDLRAELDETSLGGGSGAAGVLLRVLRSDEDRPGQPPVSVRFALLESLILHGSDVLMLADQRGQLAYVSANLQRLFGVRLPKALPRLDTLFLPEDAAPLLTALRDCAGGRAQRARFLGAHGPRWVQLRFDDRRGDAALGGILVQMRDITLQLESETALRETQASLRLNEDYYRMMIEGSIDLIGLLDLQGRVVFVNTAVTRVLGYRPTEILGRHVQDYVVPEDVGKVEAVLKSVGSDSGWESLKVLVRHKDGGSRLLDARARGSVDPDGRPVVVVGARDVTSEKELEEKRIKQSRLEAVGRLAGGVAHDFNNLLAVILGNTELALGEDTDGRMRGRLDQTYQASLKASELVGQLLAVGRRRPSEPRRVDVVGVLRENQRFLSGVLGAEGRLLLSLPEGPLPVLSDRSDLERAFLNLASNAGDAMPQGGTLSVTVSEERRAGPDGGEEKAWVRITFKDSGMGMTEEVRGRLFEPYFTTRGAGNGLGLSMVLGVVQQAGGHIQVESVPGVGSDFILYIPLYMDAADVPEGRRSAPTVLPEAFGAGRTVLLVDDDANVRRLAYEALERLGFSVMEACHGEEAMAVWRESRFHGRGPALVLSDIVMPRMSGIQLATAIRTEDPSQAVALFSGYYEKVPGADDKMDWAVLKKPFNLKGLSDFLKEQLGD